MDADAFVDSIYIAAPPAEIFGYFTVPALLTSWMGDHAVVEPRAGGKFVLHLGDRTVEGEYLEVQFPSRIVISWGRQGSQRLPPGGSTLEVSLEVEGAGTRVHIKHTGLPTAERELHARGWAHYLPRLAAASTGASLPPHAVPPALTVGAD